MSSIKVLLIEDNPGDARLIQVVLNSARTADFAAHMLNTFDMEHVDRLSSGLKRLRDGGIDLILLDLSLPDSQGLDTFARVHAQASHVPIVVLTGLADAELAAEVVRRGAQDYLVKGEIDGRLLVRSMRYAIERKRAEEALRDGERQLHQQERLAAVGQLAGGIAHDFNNFLMTIMLYANLLMRNRDFPSDLRPVAQTILNESRRAAQLVSQVLDFSRRSVIDVQPVDLGSFVGEVVDILRKTLPENIRLLMDVGQGEYVVNADPTRVQQVVMNLAVNARDAMPEGGELHISTYLAPDNMVVIQFRDTGSGFAPEHVDAIFEPFFTTKDSRKGTGLGLAICRDIVERHNGRITAENASEGGSIFTVYLPLLEHL